ncbi:DNA topoisomerase I [Candidatus Methanomassiliicoccus intestinalis]|uniref:DNA topoisomerase I n=2 Tax=Candidatus Methanomassiliicoccus intestinalis TaxID=1406512 RepID=UPI0037DD352F
MSRLIISEKSDAAARIAVILSQGSSKRTSVNKVSVFQFEDENAGTTFIVGLRGHIIELDYPEELNNWSEVNLSDLIYAEPIKKISAHSIVGALRDLAIEADEIVIATDYDREGELIGMEAVRLLDTEGKEIKRARFSAFTKLEIDTAFDDLTEPDVKLADSAECRQKIDLAWGAVLTRFISISSGQGGSSFLSVGRVQSPTLALIVARHKEIEEFVPQPYWNVLARFQEGIEFHGEHVDNPFHSDIDAQKALDACEGATLGKVIKYEKNEKDEYALPPFNTTMLLMEANKLGFPASRAMKIAEDLYTAGYISYPRTDNTVYPQSLGLRRILEKLKDSEFKAEAEELLQQEKIRPSKGKVQTTDHPPIYPTEAATKKQLKGDKWTIYELVTRRFLATVAPPAKAEVSSSVISINNEKFASKGYKLIFPGWKKYYPYLKTTEIELPELMVGADVEILAVSSEKKMTQPPRRYSQGSLIQEMERLGLGTKSTRHDIIQKLYDRKYAEGNDLIPTASGIAVIEALNKHAHIVTDAKMTAKLEEDMDEIAHGSKDLDGVVNESQEMLTNVLETLERNQDQIGTEIRKALEAQHYIGKCPSCEGDLKTIRTRLGKTFIGCSNYPECNQTYPMPPNALVQPANEACECGAPRVKIIRRGQPVSISCVDPDCDTNRLKNFIAKCPSCGRDMRIIYSRAGKRFLGCTGYPDCTQTYPLPQMGQLLGTDENCSSCGSPMIMMKSSGRAWKFCANMDCPEKKEKLAKKAGKAPAKKKTTKTAAKKTTAKKSTTKKTTTKKAAPKKAAAKTTAAKTTTKKAAKKPAAKKTTKTKKDQPK